VNKRWAHSPSTIRLAGIIPCKLRCTANGSTTLSMRHIGGVMSANNCPSRNLGWLAIAVGGVILLGDVSLILFFTIGSFFGTFNDLCIAFAAILSGLLSWILYPANRAYSPRLSQLLLTAALVGALVASIGSAFVIFDVTGYFLAGLMNFFGYGLVGLWLLGLSYCAPRRNGWPRHLVQLGLISGASMAVGLLTGPGIVGRIDNPELALWFVYVAPVASLGWLLLYPIWSIWLGRLLLSNRLSVQQATET
jgi:hypothetical protein